MINSKELPSTLVAYTKDSSISAIRGDQFFVNIPLPFKGEPSYTLDEIKIAVSRLPHPKPFETLDLERNDIRTVIPVNPFPLHDSHQRGRPRMARNDK